MPDNSHLPVFVRRAALAEAAMMREAEASVALDRGETHVVDDGGAYTAKPQDVRQRLRDAFVHLSQIEMESEATRAELVQVVADDLEEMIGRLFSGETGRMVAEEMADKVVGRILGHIVGKYVMGSARAE